MQLYIGSSFYVFVSKVNLSPQFRRAVQEGNYQAGQESSVTQVLSAARGVRDLRSH